MLMFSIAHVWECEWELLHSFNKHPLSRKRKRAVGCAGHAIVGFGATASAW
jgi:hypothetical protein